MQFLKTNRLFYKKWPFKVECSLKGASHIKYYGVEDVIKWCNGAKVGTMLRYANATKIDTVELEKFAKTVKPFLDKELQIRCEQSRFNLFCKDKSLLENIIKDLDKWVVSVTEPESDVDLVYLTENTAGKVLCDNYPHGTYRYKITLSDKMPQDTRAMFLSWTKKYQNKMKIANSTLSWMEGNKRWIQEPFLYVEDKGTLTMVLLYLGNYTKRSHEFVLRSSINTPCLH